MSKAETVSRAFPITAPFGIDLKGARCPASIPWERLNQEWALRNHGGQSLEILASRGGLDPTEAAAIIQRRPWCPMLIEDALAIIGTEE